MFRDFAKRRIRLSMSFRKLFPILYPVSQLVSVKDISYSHLAGILDTACVTIEGDSIVMYFNYEWASKVSDDEMRFIYAHELMHVINGHLQTQMIGPEWEDYLAAPNGLRIPLKNIAADHFINNYLTSLPVEMGFKVPSTGPDGALFQIFCDKRFRGMSPEHIYQTLKAEKDKMTVQSKEVVISLDTGDFGKGYIDGYKSGVEDRQKGGPEAEGNQGGVEDGQEGAVSFDSDYSEGYKTGYRDGIEGREFPGVPSEDGSSITATVTSVVVITPDGKEVLCRPQSSDTPTVGDIPQSDSRHLFDEISKSLKNGAMMHQQRYSSASVGYDVNSDPLLRSCFDLFRPKRTPLNVLKDFMERTPASYSKSWMEIDGRIYSATAQTLGLPGEVGLIKPRRIREKKTVRDLVLLVDASGSIDNDHLRRFSGVILDMALNLNLENVLFVAHSDTVTNWVEIEGPEDYELLLNEIRSIKGGSGTDCVQPFHKIRDSFPDVKTLIYLTDGEWFFEPTEDDLPVPPDRLVIVTASSQARREFPFGTVVRLDESEFVEQKDDDIEL